jgi:histone acetyltransferase (RNA polymerase elongator complex component)
VNDVKGSTLITEKSPVSERHRIYPIFLPHMGCPFRCVYCNQHAVNAAARQDGSKRTSLESLFEDQFTRVVEEAARSSIPGEIAFYGGTFTALPLHVLKRILGAASARVEEGLFTGIRFSTRPDGITPQICSFLADYPIRTVELGVQSLSDVVLEKSQRGYSAAVARSAAHMVREHGWKLGLQLMVGLPGDNRELFYSSVVDAIKLEPDLVRIYPTIILSGTALEEWYRTGLYQPLSLKEAILWCVPAYDLLRRSGIPIARMGLHADPELEKPGRIVAGPYHPSFGFLVRVHSWRQRVDGCIEAAHKKTAGTQLVVRVSERIVSEVTGPRRVNALYWLSRWKLAGVKVSAQSSWPVERLECLLDGE